MRNGGRFLALLVLASSLLAQPLAAQTVTNVRATQLPDKTVEVLYDLSGAASAGATVTVAFSSDGGGTYAITPSAGALSGHVGTGIASGTNRRIVWNAAAALPAQTYGTNYRAAVTAKQTPQTGELSFKLAWQSCADLDLYVKDPAGYEIYFDAKTSPSGGELDVDANADCDECVQGPIENVYWRTGSAPAGRYEAWVSLFSTCSVAPPIAYVLTIMRGGEVVQTHSGSLSTSGQTSTVFSYTVESGGSGGQEITVTLPGGVPLVLVRIPAGTFQMGSPTTERSRGTDETLHPVTLTSDYYIGKYEVTQAQWQAVMDSNPSWSSSCGGNCPVEQVSWDDIRGANGFIARLNQLLGTTKFRLPTEAEWERAARGGTQTRFSFGDALSGDDACGANAAANTYVWWCGNAGGGKPNPVGTKGANPYGLFDMHGNVWEWVEDWYGSYPSTAVTNPTGPTSGSYRVSRGGGWYNDLQYTRSAFRGSDLPDRRYLNFGFRLARSL